jgi:cysteine-rich repeat protein
VVNPTGIFSTYCHFDSVVTIPSLGVVNTTFITSDRASIEFVQYSILFFDQSQADVTTKVIIQLGTTTFSGSNSAPAQTFLNGILPRYTGINNLMFFGLGGFNFSTAGSKQYALDTTNYNNLYSTYSLTNVASLKLAYFFAATRDCGSDYFYKNWVDPTQDACVTTCSGTIRPGTDSTNKQCLPCHRSCLTCTGTTSSSCLSCNASSPRALSGNSCPCMSGYLDTPSGNGQCVRCYFYLTGCNTCSSPTFCTNCLPGFTITGSNTCACAYSLVNGYCTSMLGCTMVSLINSTQTCTSCNSSLLMALSSLFTCKCYFGTTTLANGTCLPTCGDNYVLSIESCDDGNLLDGDGCNSSCKVENYWVCTGTLAQGSTCKLPNVTVLSYVGILRDTSANRALLYYLLSPAFPQFALVDLKAVASTDLPSSNY